MTARESQWTPDRHTTGTGGEVSDASRLYFVGTALYSTGTVQCGAIYCVFRSCLHAMEACTSNGNLRRFFLP